MKSFSCSEYKSHLELNFHVAASANALSLLVARELAALARKTYASWDRPVVVRSGHGRIFCSGGNLHDYAKVKTKSEGLKINREIQKCLAAFAAWPTFKLAYVEGDVLGGGLEWLAHFDGRWCAPGSSLSFWQRRIGLTTGWGGGARWASILGEARVKQMLMESRLICAPEALRLGLMDRIVLAENLSAQLADLAPGGARVALGDWSASQEAKVFQSVWDGPEHRRALEQFVRPSRRARA